MALNGLSTIAPRPATSRSLRVTSVRPLVNAVAASSQIDVASKLMAAGEVDPVEWRGRKQRLQTHLGWRDKALSKKQARPGLARGIRQGRGNAPDQVRVLLADMDLHPDEAPAPHARAMTRERGFCSADHSHNPEYPGVLPETRTAASRQLPLLDHTAEIAVIIATHGPPCLRSGPHSLPP